MPRKSLNIDIVMSWEYGLIVFFVGLFLIAYGVRQGKNKDDDFTKLPITKPQGSCQIVFQRPRNHLEGLWPLLRVRQMVGRSEIPTEENCAMRVMVATFA